MGDQLGGLFSLVFPEMLDFYVPRQSLIADAREGIEVVSVGCS
jgi:hypothetical protein